jgi:hypothetical protein
MLERFSNNSSTLWHFWHAVAFSARQGIFGILGIPLHSGTPLYGRAKIPDLDTVTKKCNADY